MILLSDFCQMCPVICRGSKAQILDASIKNCSFWPQICIYHLIHHWQNAEDIQFTNIVDAIRDRAGPEVPLNMLRIVNEMNDIINFVFPPNILHLQPTKCLKRSILAPTNCQVDAYNEVILRCIQKSERLYMATDSLKEVNAASLTSPASTLDLAAKQTPPGLPLHAMSIKMNSIYWLLHNFSLDRGLVKNVCVIVTRLGNHLITVKLIHDMDGNDKVYGNELLIPHITFTSSLPSSHMLLRHQFLFAPRYATTFNSCQGLNLVAMGVDLIQPMFSHGQLYTTLSRIPNCHSTIVRLHPGEHSTINVMYPELLLH
jgi:hypothetical protein